MNKKKLQKSEVTDGRRAGRGVSAEAPGWESSSRKCPDGGLRQQEVVDGMNEHPSSGRVRTEAGCDLTTSSLMARTTAGGQMPDSDGPAEECESLAHGSLQPGDEGGCRRRLG